MQLLQSAQLNGIFQISSFGRKFMQLLQSAQLNESFALSVAAVKHCAAALKDCL